MAATLPKLETVTLRRGSSNGAELRIELNRPERMNAWDKQLGTDLLAAVEMAAGDQGVRAVTITGAGRAFSSGADLRAGFDPTPEGDLDVGAALAERLATGPTRAYAAAKQQLNARAYARLDEQLELEASLQQQMAGSPDFGEGVQAFLE